MKKFLSLLLAMIMVLSLVACGSKPAESAPVENKPAENTPNAPAEVKYAESVTIARGGALDMLDPTQSWGTDSDMYFTCVFETLVKYDGTTGEILPLLAETAEFTDENNNRIHIVLRDDVYFSNGEKLTTEDVEYSIGRTTRSTIQQYYAGCEIVDDREMYINMKDTCGEWLGALGISFSSIVCKSAAEANPEGSALIGTGPYVYDMDSFIVDSKLTLKQNENYWGELPITKELNFVLIKDASARAVAVANGDVDFADELNGNEIPVYQANKNLAITTYPSTNFLYMAFNDKRDSDNIPESELALRRAIACAINREEIIAAVGGGNSSPMISMWRPDAAYISDESAYDINLGYDPEQAKAYLADADTTEIECYVSTSGVDNKLVAQVVQEQLRQVGITMNIVESDNAGVNALSKAEMPTFELLLSNNYITFLPCAGWGFFQHMSGINKPAMNDAEILSALDIVMTTDDLDQKIENLQAIQKENHDQVSYLPLYWCESNYAFCVGLENFTVDGAGVKNFTEVYKIVG